MEITNQVSDDNENGHTECESEAKDPKLKLIGLLMKLLADACLECRL